ncbi:hypothetical protein [Amycolatopsis sp. NPDC059657]|uniref:hypothetical protein n=1 Tax=Amycolatopsis sp. NPDC059657 TaxID=3346899 RepID=UPI003670C854
MNRLIKRGLVVVAFVGAGVVVPAIQVGAATANAAVIQETQTFSGWDFGNSPSKAKNNAVKDAQRQAAIAGYIPPAQCVTTFTDSSRWGPGYYYGTAVISCTR